MQPHWILSTNLFKLFSCILPGRIPLESHLLRDNLIILPFQMTEMIFGKSFFIGQIFFRPISTSVVTARLLRGNGRWSERGCEHTLRAALINSPAQELSWISYSESNGSLTKRSVGPT